MNPHLRFGFFSVVGIVLASVSMTSASDRFADRLFLRFGGMRPGSGIASGLEYRDSHFGNGIADFRIETRISIRLYQRHEAEVIFPHVGNPRVFVEVLGLYRSQTQIDYFGIGPDSSVDDHSNYRVDGLAGFATLGFRPRRKLQFGGRVGYLQSTVKSGTDSSLPSIEDQFPPALLPGIRDSSDHVLIGGFMAVDTRDDIEDPSSGGSLELQAVRYVDRGRGRYGFDELATEAQFFVTPRRRTSFGIRARAVLTQPLAGQEIPFFLLPSLGGNDSLHAFENDRFRDRDSIWLNQVLRFRATPTIRLELFLDAGQVAPELASFRLENMELSYGIGALYKLADSILAGVFLGFGREGPRLSFQGDFRF